MTLNKTSLMARAKLSDSLKAAIHDLPHKEKDKLLYRLIAKDDILTEQLEFRLLEHEATTEDRRGILRDHIIENLKSISQQYSPGAMLWSVRKFSSIISRHTRVTKDKYGEIELNLILIKECLEKYGERLSPFWNQKSNKLREYLIKKIARISVLSAKIHPDYRLDFAELLQEIGAHIGRDDTLMHMCIKAGVEVNDLLNGEFIRKFN